LLLGWEKTENQLVVLVECLIVRKWSFVHYEGTLCAEQPLFTWDFNFNFNFNFVDNLNDKTHNNNICSALLQ
jgi:hypothetical protein